MSILFILTAVLVAAVRTAQAQEVFAHVLVGENLVSEMNPQADLVPCRLEALLLTRSRNGSPISTSPRAKA